MYQLVCNNFHLCILLNHLIALFVHLHAAYLSVYFVTWWFFSLNSLLFPLYILRHGGSFHSIAFSSHVFVITFTFPVHLHPPVCCGIAHTICHHTFIMCSVLYINISGHTCLLTPNNNYFAPFTVCAEWRVDLWATLQVRYCSSTLLSC